MTNLKDPERLKQYEHYLLALARAQLNPKYRAKVGASDIVQQSMMQAYQAIDDFRGQSEGVLRAWLRQILARNLIHLDRDFHRDKRDIERERSMEDRLGKSSLRLEGMLAADGLEEEASNLLRVQVVVRQGGQEQGTYGWWMRP